MLVPLNEGAPLTISDPKTTVCDLCFCFRGDRGSYIIDSGAWVEGKGDCEKLLNTRKFLFHDECEECSQLPPEPLCDVCQHMRLGHIIRCWIMKGHQDPRSVMLCQIPLSFGTFQDVQNRAPKCKICRLWASSLGSSSRAMHGDIQPDHEVEIILFAPDMSFPSVECEFSPGG